MNKFFKSLLALLVLITFSSCVMEVANTNNNENQSLEFNFRSVRGFTGATLEVSVSSKGSVIETKSQAIEDNKKINFIFENLLIGDTVEVTASIKKNNVAIYTGSESKKIEIGVNEVNLSLDPAEVFLTLSPNLDISNEELEGAKFFVVVNNTEYDPIIIDKAMDTVSTNIGLTKYGSRLTIKAQILSKDDVVLYTSTQSLVYDGSPKISLDLNRENIRVYAKAVLPERVGADSIYNGATYNLILNKEDQDNARTITDTVKKGNQDILIDLGYFKNGTTINSIEFGITKQDYEKPLLSSERILNYTVDNSKGNEGIVYIALDLIMPVDIVLPKSITHEQLEQYRGSILEVTINGVSKELELGSIPIKSSTGSSEPSLTPMPPIKLTFDLHINAPLKISAKVFDNQLGNIYLSYAGEFTPTSPKYEIPNMVRNDGYVIWKNTGSQSEDFVSVIYPSSTEQLDYNSAVNSPFASEMSDFAFTPDGGVWILNAGGNPDLTYRKHGSYYQSNSISFEDLENSNVLIKSGTDTSITISDPTALKSVAIYNDNLMLTNYADKKLYSITISQKPGKLDTIEYSYTDPNSASTTGYRMGEIAISGTTIYAHYVKQNEMEQSQSVRIYKGTINEAGKSVTFVDTPIFDSETFTNENQQKTFENTQIAISDLQIIGNTLYALILDVTEHQNINYSGYSGNNSRGGLLIIENETNPILKGYNTTPITSGSNFFYNTETGANTKFVGPRKFIAIKPKKIVIADAGAIVQDVDPKPTTIKLQKRITTVSLDNYAMSHNVLPETALSGDTTSSGSNKFYQAKFY